MAVTLLLALLATSCGASGSDDQDDGASAASDTSVVALPPCPIDAQARASGPVEVVVWSYFFAKTGDTFNALVERYNASQSKVHVRHENQGFTTEELQRKYQDEMVSGELPAIVAGTDGMLGSLVDSGTVLPAQSCIDAEGYDTSDLVPAATAYFTVGGALYPGSVTVSMPVLFYIKDHFRRAGLDPEDPPQTLAEMRTAAEQIKAAGIAETPVALLLSPYLLEPILTGEGIPLVDNDNGRGDGETTAAAFDTEQTREVYTWIRDMHRDGLLLAVPYTQSNADHFNAMAMQHSSMLPESSLAATSIEAFIGPVPEYLDNVAAGPMPGLTGAAGSQMLAWGFFITNRTPPEVQAAAWDFLKWMNETEQQVTWTIEGSALPFRTSVANDPRVVQRWSIGAAGRMQAVAWDELMATSPENPGPLIGPYDKTREALTNSLDRMVFDNTEPDAVITDAAEETTTAIQQYNDANF